MPEDKLDKFKEELIPILQQLPWRSLKLLRPNNIQILKNLGQKNTKNICSKHWWFDFMKKNSDIKEIWDQIPLRENCRKSSSPVSKELKNEANQSFARFEGEEDDDRTRNNRYLKTLEF